MDLTTTIPDFPIESYSHIIPSLEKAKISVTQLLLLDAVEIAKQTRVPVPEVRKLTNRVLEALQRDLGLEGIGKKGTTSADIRARQRDNEDGCREDSCGRFRPPILSFISTLDPVLDDLFAGGISTSYVTEIAGESGGGKTQLLLQLLLAVQLPPPFGLSKNALYVSTEADLATKRLLQLLEEHTALSSLSPDIQRPSLDNILSVTAVDLETQDHILNYHVPAAITRCNIGLVVIDSITANYRAESSTGNVDGLLERAWELKKLGRLLRNLAAKHNIAIVVANQISDRLSNGSSWLGDLECLSSPFGERPKAQLSSQQLHLSPQLPSSLASYPPIPGTAPSSSMYPTQANITQSSTPLPSIYDRRIPSGTLQINIRSIHSVLTFAYQQPFYTGWGDPYDSKSCKTPALGQVWTNELGCRIVLKIHDTKEMNDISAILKSTAHHFNASSEAKGEATHRLSIDAVTQEEEQGVRRDEVKNEKEARKEMQHQNQPLARCHDQAKYIPVSRPDTISRPTFRRKRTVEVVFSPWTSGNSSSKSENNQNMPTQYNMVEVEILPSGLRGIPTC